MENPVKFKETEYKKLMSVLGLEEKDQDNNEERYDLISAWNFGQTEDDYKFITSNSTSACY